MRHLKRHRRRNLRRGLLVVALLLVVAIAGVVWVGVDALRARGSPGLRELGNSLGSDPFSEDGPGGRQLVSVRCHLVNPSLVGASRGTRHPQFR